MTSSPTESQSPKPSHRGRAGGPVAAWMAVMAVVAALGAAAGCTPSQYAGQADRAAGRVLRQKQQLTLGAEAEFSIDYDPFTTRVVKDRPTLGGKPIPMGAEPARALSLQECVTIAFRNSRQFQDRKEDLYIAALDLANARHNWSLLSGDVEAEASRSVVEGGAETNAFAGTTGLSFAQQFANGGAVTLGLALEAASDLLGIGSTTFGSMLEANFTQPLLRGAWRGFAYEDLYRRERNLAIAVLAYERFRQTFAADTVTGYYNVLRQLDELRNEEANIARLEQTFRRTQVQVKGGQVSRIQQDQAEQNLLRARVRFATNRQRYRDVLDRYKITLGLPIRSSVVLPLSVLQGLNEREPAAVPFLDEKAILRAGDEAVAALAAEATGAKDQVVVDRVRAEAVERALAAALPTAEGKAIAIALGTRPDVLTERARLRDARRDVQIAADQFNPSLNLALSISAPGTAPRLPHRVQFNRHTRSAGLVLNYDFDQTNNRDAYRLSQIDEARARRDYAEFLDEVRFDVRRAYRQLVQSRRSYTLEQRNVIVAGRRRKLAVLEQSAGQATARDVLEAEEGLRLASNGLTTALISYETTRIQFLATLGMLEVDETGVYRERAEAFLFDRMAARYDHLGGQVDEPSGEKP